MLRAVHSFKAGDLGAGEAAARRVLELEPEGDSWARFVTNCVLGVTLYWQGAHPRPRGPHDAARTARETGNDLGQSYALGYLALAAADRQELDEAAELADAALGPSEDPGVAEHFVTMIGHLARGMEAESRGRLEDAEGAFQRAVELAARGAGRIESAYAELALARVQHALGKSESAKDLLRDAQKTLADCPDPGPLPRAVAAAARGLGVVTRRSEPAPLEAEELTDRELAVLRLLKSDLSRREIGEALYVSANTVKTHVRGIYRKLDASTREQAVTRARELGLI